MSGLTSTLDVRTDKDVILYHILAFEQGYANIKGDKGGPTMFGISSYYNPDFKDKIVNKELTLEEAKNIYYSKYLTGWKFDYFYGRKNRLAYLIGDARVLGESSIKPVQQALNDLFGNKLKTDGIIGRRTLAALDALTDEMLGVLGSTLILDAKSLVTKFSSRFVDSYIDRCKFRGQVLLSGFEPVEGSSDTIAIIAKTKSNVLGRSTSLAMSTLERFKNKEYYV